METDRKSIGTLTFEVYSTLDEEGEPQIIADLDFQTSPSAMVALGPSLAVEAVVAVVRQAVEADLDQLQEVADAAQADLDKSKDDPE